MLTKKCHCRKFEKLRHKNLAFRFLPRLFNISEHSETHFKMVANDLRNIYTAFIPDMNT